jgi:hypothetical protein
MNCEEVKNNLTDYLDKSLDMATTTRVATHIISCPPCRAETSEISDCVQQIAALPLIDPPLGFAQRVMAHVREIEPEQSIWRRWFLPFGSRVPLQAAAVVLVAVLAGFLYQKEDRSKNLGGSEMASSLNSPAPQATKAEVAAASQLAGESKTIPTAPTTLAGAKPVETLPLKKNQAESANPQIQTALADKLAVEPRQEESVAVKRAPIPVQEVSNPRNSGQISGDTFGFDFGVPSSMFRQPVRRLESAAIERSVAPLLERSADIEFVVRRHASQRRDQADGLSAASLRKSADTDGSTANSATAVAQGSAPATKIESIAEIRYYNVAPEHFDSFKKDLAQESVIETESKLSLREKEMIAQSARPFLIKVTILPPAAADASATPR